jgi:hypothetical protein
MNSILNCLKKNPKSSEFDPIIHEFAQLLSLPHLSIRHMKGKNCQLIVLNHMLWYLLNTSIS